MMRGVHWCVTVDYQQIGNGNSANQIHRFNLDYGKCILMRSSWRGPSPSQLSRMEIENV